MTQLAHAYFDIVKAEKQADGTLMVYGKATDDSLDIDQQICDGDWLKQAMPNWFETGGNIREQHSSIAAGVATELEQKGTAWYVKARVVDPSSVKKVEYDVLKGFSVGIKNPRVIHDEKAANGRIIDGQIVEISLVDRPANPTCQLTLAKSANGNSTLVQVEELREDITKMTKEEALAVAKSIAGDITKFDAGLYEAARTALAQLIIVEAQEQVDGHNETDSLNSLINALSALEWWYRGEEAEGETHGESHEGEMKMSKKKDMDAEAEAEAKKKESDAEAEAEAKKKDADAEAEADAEAAKKKDAEADAETEAMDEKDAEAGCKCACAECQIGKGCDSKACKCVREMAAGMGEQNSGPETSANLDDATIEAPKSAEPESSSLNADEVEAIVEKAVKSAVDSAMAEAEANFSAKEAELLAKTASLEEELAKTKSLAIAGGPKRTAPAIDLTSPNNLLVKAAVARAKANATTDPDLKKGYLIQAEEYTKAADAQLNKSV